jgi:transposase
VWAYPGPVDLRKGYDGLSAIVVGPLKKNVLSGDCFLFTNRTRTRAKVLVWDGTGLVIYQKLTMSELSLFLEGCQWVETLSLSPTRFVLGAASA